MNILSIIPARSGSKGLKNKNILKLNSKPLIAWSIEASLKSNYITKTIVSSDSEEILDIANKFGAEILLRDKTLSSDTSSSENVIIDVIEKIYQQQNITFDYIILLQPTSPLRTNIDIDSAFDIMFKNNSDSVISLVEIDNKILKAFKIKEGYITPISDNKKHPFIPRQQLPTTYMPNGAIYIIKTSSFIENKELITNKTIPYIMPQERSIDIDNQEDLEFCENLIAKLGLK